MEEKYKIFDKGFNKVLDLIEYSDAELFNRYKSALRFVPKKILCKLQDCEDVSFNTEGYSFEMLRTENSLNIEFNLEGEKYLKTQMYIRRIFAEDLLDDDKEEIKIFSIYQRNSKDKKHPYVFEDNNGVLRAKNYKDDENSKELGVDFVLEKDSFGIYLVRYTTVRGVVLREVKDVLDLDDMYEYLEVEDEYEEELEVEFTLDEDDDWLNGDN